MQQIADISKIVSESFIRGLIWKDEVWVCSEAGEWIPWPCGPLPLPGSASSGIFKASSLTQIVLRYLTNGQPSIERFPISFKTYFSGNYFHHVVLGIYCNGRYGSLGMSRRAELMDKPLTFRTLSDLIFDFEDSYKKYLHTVKKVKIGLYVPHEPHSFQPIEWKQLVHNVSKMLRADIRKELEKYARDMRMKVSARKADKGCKTLLSFSLSLSLSLSCHVPCVSEMANSFLRLSCLLATF